MSRYHEHRTEKLKKIFPFESKYFQIGNLKLHYVDEGEGNVLVLLHGCPTWSFYYRNLIHEFSKTHRVIAIDQMGLGLSDKPYEYDYRVESHIDNFERFADAFSLQDITFIMNGRGTAIGMAYAVRHPDNVRGIITGNAMPFSGFSLPWWLEIPKMNRWSGEKLIMDMKLYKMAFRKFSPEVVAAYEYPFPTRESRVALLRFIENVPCVPEDDSSQTMLEIESALWLLRDHPASTMWGMKDRLYKKKYFEKWCQYLPSGEHLTFKNSGRFILEEEPEPALAHIKSFLNRNQL